MGNNVYNLIAKISADVSGMEKGLNQATDRIKGFAKGAVAIFGALKIGQLIGDSVEAGGKLQQSLGGVETLFKKHADIVIKNAERAYKTTGMSANDYMENVTSFSASLLQSLGGNTEEAARVADRAMTDISDNVNKFGTAQQDVMNAYQGFSKSNYTMLDNLNTMGALAA